MVNDIKSRKSSETSSFSQDDPEEDGINEGTSSSSSLQEEPSDQPMMIKPILICTYKCQICEIAFKDRKKFSIHSTKHVAPGGFICRECKQPFVTDTERGMHMQLKHKTSIILSPDGKDKLFKCTDCDAKFLQPSKLRQHHETKCGTLKPYACTVCGSRFISESTLRVHSTIHTEKKSFLCRFCGSRFLSKGELKVHERRHTGEKPFKCDKCPKSFSFRESLVTHSSVHTGIKPYICPACNNCFSCIGNLNKHRRVRPESCGLPQYRGSTKCAPRASAKIKDAPAINQQANNDNETNAGQQAVEASDTEHILPDIEMVDCVNDVSNVDDGHQEIGSGQPQHDDCFDISFIEELDDDAEQWPEAVEFVQSTDMDDLSKYVHLNVLNDNEDNNDEELLKTTAPEFLDDDDSDTELMEAESGFTLKEAVNDEASDGNVAELEIERADEIEVADVDRIKDVDLEMTFIDGQNCSIMDEANDDSLVIPIQMHAKRKSTKPPSKFVKVDPAVIPTLHLSAKIPRPVAKTARLPAPSRTKLDETIQHRCEVCNKTYKSAGSLKTHATMHTGELPHKCTFCDKAFRTQGQKTIHERKHTGEKPFRCEFCDKSFAYRESLLTHISTHTGVKRFHCQGCGSQFSCITNLQAHRRTHVSTCGQTPKVTKAMLLL